MWDNSYFRKEALVRRLQPDRLDDPLRVTAPRERAFSVALLVVWLALAGWIVLAA